MQSEYKEITKDIAKQLGGYKFFGLFDQVTKTHLPLKQLNVNAKIQDYIAEITYTQTYNNPFEIRLETDYFFPISSGACFNSFQAKFGNTTIQGLVKEKEEARQTYEHHKEQGDLVAYAEITEESESVMCVKIGNIPPGAEIEITLSYIERVEISMNKFWRLTLYSSLVPATHHLLGGQPNGAKINNNSRELSTQDDLLANTLPTFVKDLSSGPPGIKWAVNVAIDSRSPITFLKSSSHEVEIVRSEMSGVYSAKVSLAASKNYTLSKDFVLLYCTDSINRPSYLLSPYEQGYCTLINFFPQLSHLTLDDAFTASLEGKSPLEGFASRAQNEYLFVLDTSQSMEGSRIGLAIRVLKKFLKLLPDESYFNILNMSETFNVFAEKSVKKSKDSINEATSYLNQISLTPSEARIEKVLEFIADSEQIKDHSRIAFVLSAGRVDMPTSKVTQYIKNRFYKTRLFGIGIGDGSTTDFIKKASVEGYGSHEIIRTSTEIREKVTHLLHISTAPYFTDFELKVENESLFSYIVPLPKTLGCIAPNELVEFFVIFNKKFQEAKSTFFTLRFYNGLNHRFEEYRERISIDHADHSEPVVKLGIQKFCDSLAKKREMYEAMQSDTGNAFRDDVTKKLIATSIKYGILTNHTAFVCVIKEGDDIIRQIPSQKMTFLAEQISDAYDGQSSVRSYEGPHLSARTIKRMLTEEEQHQMKIRFQTKDLYGYIDIIKQPTIQERLRSSRYGDYIDEPELSASANFEDGANGDKPIDSITTINLDIIDKLEEDSRMERERERNYRVKNNVKLDSDMNEDELASRIPVLTIPQSSVRTQPDGNDKYNTNMYLKSEGYETKGDEPTHRELLASARDNRKRGGLFSPRTGNRSISEMFSNMGLFTCLSPRGRREAEKTITKTDTISSEINSKVEIVSKLTKLQKKNGSWEANRSLAKTLGYNYKDLLEKLPESLRLSKDKEKIWLTILVLAWVNYHYNSVSWWPSSGSALEWLKGKGQDFPKNYAFARNALGF